MNAILGQISTSRSRIIVPRMQLESKDKDQLTKVLNYCTLLKAQFTQISQKAISDKVTNSLPVKEISKIILLKTVFFMAR